MISRYLAMELVDTERVSASDLHGNGAIDPWCADGSIEEGDAIGRRNRDICRRLMALFTGAEAADEVEEYDEYLDGDLPQEAVLRRLHRSRAVSAPWRGGRLVIRLYDRAAWISLQVADLIRAEHPEFAADLAGCLQRISAVSGMQPRDVLTGQATSAERAAASVLEKNARTLERLSRQVLRQRWQHRLGLPSLAILCLLAAALCAGILASAFDRGNLLLHVDAAAPQTFVTETLAPPVYRLRIFPRFFLEGRIDATNQRVRLPVYRKEYLRAGPGAPFTVLPTYREVPPYVLRSDFDSAGPQLRLGGFGLQWFAALALLPPLLVYWFVLRPILRAPPQSREHRVAGATRTLVRLLVMGGIFALAVWVRTRR